MTLLQVESGKTSETRDKGFGKWPQISLHEANHETTLNPYFGYSCGRRILILVQESYCWRLQEQREAATLRRSHSPKSPRPTVCRLAARL